MTEDIPIEPLRLGVELGLVKKIKTTLESGLENTQAVLIDHDVQLGRTTNKNRWWAETLEKEIADHQDCIKQLSDMLINVPDA